MPTVGGGAGFPFVVLDHERTLRILASAALAAGRGMVRVWVRYGT